MHLVIGPLVLLVTAPSTSRYVYGVLPRRPILPASTHLETTVRTSSLAILLIPAFTFPTLAPAQALERGARVRVVTGQSSEPRIGTVLSATADSAMVKWEHTDFVNQLALADAARLDVSVGKHRQARKGLAWGFASGVIGGAILGAATYEPCTDWCIFGPNSRGAAAMFGAGVFGVLGGGFGALIGALTTSEQWQPATLRPMVGRAAGSPGRLDIGLSYSR